MTKNNRNEDLYDQYLSAIDLEKHPEWKKAWKNQDKTLMAKILYDMGADLEYGYNFAVCYHRPRTSKETVNAFRVSFRERRDHEWVMSMMELEDVIRVTEDRGMRQDMMQMSKRLSSGGTFKVDSSILDEKGVGV